MSQYINETVQNIPYSGIRKFFDVANEIEGAISLGVGEPDFLTPWTVRAEAIKTLEKRRTAYTSNAGLPELRKEISKYIKNMINLEYSPIDQILVTVGASEAIDIFLRAVLDRGDEVLVIEPCYVSYTPCVLMAGGVPVVVNTKSENDFKVTRDDIESKITSKTKVAILSYPNNPTGAIMSYDELKNIADLFIKHDILVISDEIYSELTYSSEKHASIAQVPNMVERTLVINGFSKAFSMTGWRLGYALGPKEIIAAMTKIHQYVIMCASTIAQYSGVEALRNNLDKVEEMKEEYDNRRRFMLKGFEKIGLPCFTAKGAFYLFPSIKHTGLSSEEFCTRLLKEEKLAVVPGNAFGECGEGHIRCSYAYSVKNLGEALIRMEKFLKKI